MLKGEAPYDAAVAQKSADAIAAAAKKVPDALKPNTGDAGPTEAKATIWSNWQGFTDKATALDTEASKLADRRQEGRPGSAGRADEGAGWYMRRLPSRLPRKEKLRQSIFRTKRRAGLSRAPFFF